MTAVSTTFVVVKSSIMSVEGILVIGLIGPLESEAVILSDLRFLRAN